MSYLKAVTAKAIYISGINYLPLKAELKYSEVNFQELVYPILTNSAFEVKQRAMKILFVTFKNAGWKTLFTI